MTFQGKDKDGNKAQFVIHISAAPGNQTLYVLKQVEVPKGAVYADVAAGGVGIASGMSGEIVEVAEKDAE